MQLTYQELRKRDVINITDGRCLGRIINLTLSFPSGTLEGITVPGRRVYGFRLFDNTEIYIDKDRIIKIGGDVILVRINCGEVCSPSTKPSPPPNKCCPPNNNHGFNEFLERIDKDDY